MMNKITSKLAIPGGLSRGVKREIPIEFLELDKLNPRLSTRLNNNSEFEVLRILYEQYELEELAYSMSENGYFDEEPIVVIPKNVEESFGQLETKARATYIDTQIAKGSGRFLVLEGNRRIATLRILLDSGVRKKLNIKDFPRPRSKEIENDLKCIPAIVYSSRDEVISYLGVRHIIGVLKWEAYEKAYYVSQQIDKQVQSGEKIEDVVKRIQESIGDRSDVIKRQYMAFNIAQQAEEEIDFDISNVKRRFSLLYLSLGYGSIREFIGAPSFKDKTIKKKVVPKSKLGNLNLLLSWIYGKGTHQPPIITDSRKISNQLSPILSNKDATQYLKISNDLNQAYELSDGEKNFLTKKLTTASNNLSAALGIAFKYKNDSEFIQLIDECETKIVELKKLI